MCYYEPTVGDNNDNFWATFAVYRRVGSVGDIIHYERVSTSFTAERSNIIDNNGKIDLMCYNENFGGSQLAIQAGDVVGACVFERRSFFRNRLPLDIVGEFEGNQQYFLLQTDCNILNELPSEISTSQLSTVSSRRLHLYANICKLTKQVCMLSYYQSGSVLYLHT